MNIADRQTITYSDGVTEVRPGDVVTCRAWIWLFRKKRCRVVYVPGISKRHGGMEHGGMKWVGTRFDDGAVIGTAVDPEMNELRKSVQFVRRGDEPVEQLDPKVELEG